MKKIKILTIGILAFFLLSFLNSYCNAQEERTITVEEGSFVFKNLSIKEDGFQNLKGDVTNYTSKNWNEVCFEIDLYDNSGNKLKVYSRDSFSFYFYDLKKGETKSIGYGNGESLIGIDKNVVISRYELRFKTGKYPAKYNFVMTKPKASKELTYEDSSLKIVFSITKKQIGFILQNKTENPIKIDWNQVSYVDVLSESHKVMHSGVKYMNKATPQPPTLIPPTAKLEDIVFPIDYVSYSSGRYGSWIEEDMFPEAPTAKLYKGKSFSVFMPLEINGIIKNYFFSFKVEDVES